MSRISKIIGLVGLAGTGKSTAGAVIRREFGFRLIQPADAIRQELNAQKRDETPENERIIQMEIRQKLGMDALVRLCREKILSALREGNGVLIDSMCSYSELIYLKNSLEDYQSRVIAFHSTRSRRIKRLASRVRRSLSAEQMHERDELEVTKLEKGIL